MSATAATVSDARAGRDRRTWGRTRVRVTAVAGVMLVAAAGFGWWLDSRVIDDNGFADVVAQASQRQPVRDYIADQATLRLARTSNFVTAARPAVTEAVAEAFTTRPVVDAIREFARRAHQQVFEARAARRLDIDAQQASVAVRSALQSINPAMAKKLPANVLDASATVSQNRVVDALFRLSSWMWLWIPVGLAGVAMLAWTLRRAADPVRAVRTVGVTLAVAGAILAGFGLATPVVAGVVAPTDPARAEAIATFVAVLVGRLAGTGLALIAVGLALALAPGRDGGDLRGRAEAIRTWGRDRLTRRRWRFAGGVALMLLATLLITRPAPTARAALDLVAFLTLYVGVVVCLRAAGILTTDRSIARLRRRWLVVVPTVMALAMFGSVSATVAVASAANTAPRADLLRTGCNGYFELCAQPLDQIVWPASHNAMSSAAYNFLGAEHVVTIPEQLNSGIRFLMLDLYYGYEDNGIVRTNLAGGVNQATLERERGKEAVGALRRLGALTGTADVSGHKQELYFCHDLCELGAIKAVDVFREIKTFLDRNLTELLVLDFEDYVQPRDLKVALQDSGLWDRIRTVSPEELHAVPLGYLLTPKPGESENPRRVVTVSEKHGGVYRWLPPTYSLFEETPFTFGRIADFSCAPKRGQAGNPMFLINHWLRPDGPPDPVTAGHVNSTRVLLDRFHRCAAQRHRLPNVIAVDFTQIGSLFPVVRDLNAAIAKVTGVTPDIDRAIKHAIDGGDLTEAQAAEIRGLHRFGRMTLARARALLGAAAGELTRPTSLDKVEADNGIDRPPVTGLPDGPPIPPRYVKLAADASKHRSSG